MLASNLVVDEPDLTATATISCDRRVEDATVTFG